MLVFRASAQKRGPGRARRMSYDVVKGISGVLVRLTACKRLTLRLPKLSRITLPPPETTG